MCGIAGIINCERTKKIEIEDLRKMTDSIRHRGPDDEGFYINNNVGLGFRRLSIIDLNTGSQPISNENETVWVIMNGEIYNYKELRSELQSKSHQFKSTSDTEVLVHLYEEYGIEFVKKIKGMFAFALFDVVHNKFFIVRDRIGIKPLFYSLSNTSLFFASELKELKSVVKSKFKINDESVLDYFTYGYVLNDKSIYTDVKKLMPATYLEIDINSFQHKIVKYWNIDTTVDDKLKEEDWVGLINEKLDEVVKSHMVSDVPLGAFLSGGVDSSAVVATMAKYTNQPIKTFSIGFSEEKFNELKYAKIVSELYKTEHHEMILEPASVNIIDDLIKIYDEPFADSSAIPTYFVSKFAAEHVKVVLSGDGGDEIFAGYNSYVNYKKIIARNRSVMRSIQPFAAMANKIIPNYMFGKGLTHTLSKNTDLLGAYSSIFKEYEINSLFNRDYLKSTKNYSSINEKIKMLNSYVSKDRITRYQLLDINAYMVDDILTKVDRASMANSIEARVPLLDHEFVELAFKIPTTFKIKNDEGKYIFKKALENRLPKEILYRKKQGFAIPLSKWFNKDLSAYLADELLSDNSTFTSYFNKKSIQELIDNHRKEKRDFSAKLWTLLFFKRWLEKN